MLKWKSSNWISIQKWVSKMARTQKSEGKLFFVQAKWMIHKYRDQKSLKTSNLEEVGLLLGLFWYSSGCQPDALVPDLQCAPFRLDVSFPSLINSRSNMAPSSKIAVKCNSENVRTWRKRHTTISEVALETDHWTHKKKQIRNAYKTVVQAHELRRWNVCGRPLELNT